MFYSDTQHDNMFLKITSDIIAFVLGCISVATSSAASDLNFSDTYNSTLLFISDPNNLMFFAKTLFSGVMALGIKVGGEMIIHLWKERKNKGGKNE